MATSRNAVPPEKAWRLGRGSTVPLSSMYAYAGAALINTATDLTRLDDIVLGTVTVGASAFVGLGMWAKGTEERRKDPKQPGVNFWQGAYVTACTCAAGTWVTWAASTAPWGPVALGAWAVGTAGAWLLYPWYRHSRRAALAAEHAARIAKGAPPSEAPTRTDWETIFDRVGLKGLRETEDRVPTPGGYTVVLALPDDGRITFATVDSKMAGLSVAAGRTLGLRSGGLRPEPGRNDGEILLHITERDVMAETIPLPDDLPVLDSNNPFDIGLFEDAQPMLFDVLRHGMIVGITDAGKSNTLNVIITRLAQCADTLTWVIDPKGGRMAKPWIQPLLDGRVTRPVLDWVATNAKPGEYTVMLKSARKEIDRRSTLGLGGEKVATSADLPRVIIIIDECADVLADTALLKDVKYIVRKGRSEGFYVLLAGQRGTADMLGDGTLRSQIHNAIGLGVRSNADASYIFPDDTTVSRLLSKLVNQGTALVKLGARGRVMPGKVYRIEYDDIAPIAIALADRRPGLPDDAARYLGDDYMGRWSTDRIKHLFVTTSDELDDPDEQPDQTTGPATTPAPGGIGTTAAKLGLPPSKILGNLGIGNTTPAGPDSLALSPEGQEIAAELEKYLAEQHAAQATASNAQDGDDDPVVKDAVMRILRDAGPAGIGPTSIADKLRTLGLQPPHRFTLTRWFKADPLIFKPAYGLYAFRTTEEN